MYNTKSRALEMAAPSTSFPFFELPCELRRHVLSFITLAPHKEAEELKPKKPTPEDDRYYEQRKICHETSKSLLLVSKAVKYEAEQLFYQHKTLILSSSTQIFMEQHIDYVLSSAGNTNLSKFRHIEFDMKHTQEDTDQNFVQLRKKLVLINYFLGKNVKKYLELQTVTCKLVDYNMGFDSPTPTSETDLIFGVQSPNVKRPIVITSSDCDSKSSESTYNQSDVEDILEEMQVFYQWANGLTSNTLPIDQWRTRKAMYKSAAKVEQAFFMHELKFEKRRQASNETLVVEEEAMSICSDLLEMVGGPWKHNGNSGEEDEVEKWLDHVMM